MNIELKKLTLISWAKILLNNGTIDISRYNAMMSKIEKLTK